MPLFVEETLARFHEFRDDLTTLEGIYKWNISLIPSSVRPTRRKPTRRLGHNGTLYTYRLLVRSRDLIHAFASAVTQENSLMAALAARAHAETTGGAALFLKKLRSFYAGRITYDQLEETLYRLLMGSKTLPGKDEVLGAVVPDPINVLTMIEAVDDLLKPVLTLAREQGAIPKDWSPFKSAYDTLSELSHPNFAGTTIGTPITRESNRPVVRFSQRPSMTTKDARLIVGSFMRSPVMLQEFVPEILQLLKESEEGPLIFRF